MASAEPTVTFDRSGCALLANTAAATLPPSYAEAHAVVRVQITRRGAVLLAAGGADEQRFTQKGAKHEHTLRVLLPSGEVLLSARLHEQTQHCRLGELTYVWSPEAGAVMSTRGGDAPAAPAAGPAAAPVSRAFQFRKAADCAELAEAMATATAAGAAASQFGSTRADSSADHYFHYYGQLMFQQNMLSDSVRTKIYRRAVFENTIDFRGKVVVDVGCGSGILSFFAAQAGARKVYAIEASRAAIDAETLIKANGLADVITVVRGKVEEVTLPEDCDIIISEPMGTLLVNERMIESFVIARDRFMKKSPTPNANGTLAIAPGCNM